MPGGLQPLDHSSRLDLVSAIVRKTIYTTYEDYGSVVEAWMAQIGLDFESQELSPI
jgi:hypothetical protein